MPTELVPLVLFAVLLMALGIAMSRYVRNRQLQREEAMRSEAAARGWLFDATNEGRLRLMRWRGVTEGISWTAEYRRGVRKRGAQHRRTHRLRWWADTLRGPSAPVLFMGVPAGKEAPDFTVAQGDGPLAAIAQKAAGYALDQAVDVYFGEEAGRQVEPAALKTLTSGTPKGFIVMAGNTPDAARQVAATWTPAIEALTADAASALSDDDERPWVLLLPRRVTLARMRIVSSAADLERVVRAGVTLVKRT